MTVVIALLAQMVAAQSPSTSIRINSMSIGEGKGPKTIGGYATIPPEAQPELCHLSLKIGTQSICRWFGEPGCRTIRFEVTLPSEQLREAVLTLSDHPLQIRSPEELQRRPGSTFAELRVDDVKIPLK
jgi:hypothetical protein